MSPIQLERIADFLERNHGVSRDEFWRAIDEGNLYTHDGLVMMKWAFTRTFRR